MGWGGKVGRVERLQWCNQLLLCGWGSWGSWKVVGLTGAEGVEARSIPHELLHALLCPPTCAGM